jgi:hypothetical protein
MADNLIKMDFSEKLAEKMLESEGVVPIKIRKEQGISIVPMMTGDISKYVYEKKKKVRSKNVEKVQE